MGVRAGVSHFLQVVIMVALVSAVGVLMYSGAAGLLGNWGASSQVIASGAYLISPSNVIITLKNTGNAPATVTSVEVYSGGAQVGINSTALSIDPGRSQAYVVSASGTLVSGQLVDVVVRLSDGAVIKYRLPLQ